MKHACTMILALTMASSALADGASFEQLLSGKEFPLTLKLKDLDGNWRRFSASSGTPTISVPAVYQAMFGAGNASVFYTKGQTVTVGGETYLVAYRPQVKPLDIVAFQAAMRGGHPPEPEKPTAITPLALALLNLRTTDSLSDIRPFNLDTELGNEEEVDDKSGQSANEASLKNLRQIGIAVMTYVSERRVLPALADAKAAREELVLYLRNKDVLNQPGTQKPYLPNPSVSGRKLTDYDKPDRIAVFYEAAPAADGTRGVLFLDGHAERIAEQQWTKIKEVSQLP